MDNTTGEPDEEDDAGFLRELLEIEVCVVFQSMPIVVTVCVPCVPACQTNSIFLQPHATHTRAVNAFLDHQLRRRRARMWSISLLL